MRGGESSEEIETKTMTREKKGLLLLLMLLLPLVKCM